ncbi:urease accessory protein UreF [Aquibacillus sediminis]|uniref:urease accessory protein UreF n=1 Tax=Aquibacillus sediminis TaxID=2574734 RepID=UPI0011092E12|nr:urease accessory protein UreF [Aquibacillus sediminis]
MNKPNVDLSNHSNTGAINTDVLYLMHIHDSAFPIGSYTQSFGMETYIQSDQIRTKQDLLNYCHAYLFENLVYTDGIFVKEAYQLVEKDDWKQLIRLERICDASKNAVETREASRMMGKQFLQAILPVFEDEKLQTWKKYLDEGKIRGHFPIAYSIYTAQMKYDLYTTILTFLYSSTVSLVHNAVRAVPLGQKAGIEVIHQLIPKIAKAAEHVLDKSLQDLSNHAVGIEVASMQHRYLPSRLFIS